MKEYKVGDTIAINAKIVKTDIGDDLPYQVSYRNGYPFWVNPKDVVEPVKPKLPELPKGVADELKEAKDNKNNFYGFLRDCNSETYPKTEEFVFYSSFSSDQMIKVLSDAWYIGYTIKPEPTRYNLILGTDPADNRVAFFKNNGSVAIDCCTLYSDLDEDAFQFTQKEIDGYNKDGASWLYNSLDLNNLKVEVEE